MTDYGLKVSKSGYDVKSAADKDLAFTSGGFVLKIHNTYTESFTIPWDDPDYKKETSIAHGLGYKPVFLAFAMIGGDQYEMCPRFDGGSDPQANVYVDDNNIYFWGQIPPLGLSYNYDFKAIVFIDELTGL